MTKMHDGYEKKLDDKKGQMQIVEKLNENLGQRVDFLEKIIQVHNENYPDFQVDLDAEFAFGFGGSVQSNIAEPTETNENQESNHTHKASMSK